MAEMQIQSIPIDKEETNQALHLVQSFFYHFNDVSIGIIAVDRKHTIILMNPMAGALLGVNPSLMIGKHISKLRQNEKIKQSFETGSAYYNLELQSNEKWLKSSYIPIKILKKIEFVVQLIQDHTEKYSLEAQIAELRRKYELLDTLIENTFEEFGAVDRFGQLTYITQKSARNLGFVRDEVLGRDITTLTQTCLLKEVATTGEPLLGRIVRKGKKKTPVVVIPLIKKNERQGALCKSIFSDIEEAQAFIQKIQGIENDKGNGLRKPRLMKCHFTFDDIIGESKVLLSTKQEAKRVAKGNSTILISGESGTGKELFAHAIHMESLRNKGPFVVINCAGVPESLLESEFFGYEAGSFTGAKTQGKPGKFELAHGGTLFLDEAGDMPISMQAKLLRAIQEKSFERLGGTASYEVDVRIIAASNKDLWDLVQKGRFREDLYYRLDVVNLQIPPLRRRLEDIPVLVNHFIPLLKNTTNSYACSVSSELINLFQNYTWPGNTRELKNVLEGAMNLYIGEELDIEALPERIRTKMMNPLNTPTSSPPNQEHRYENFLTTQEMEQQLIQEALIKTGGNKRQAACKLNISRTTLYNKIRKYKL